MALAAFLLLCGMLFENARGEGVLRFDRAAVRLLQFTDLHLGEDAAADRRTLALMRALVARERPDFIVFAGDQVTGYETLTLEQRAGLWNRALSVAADARVPFATLFGNHDDQPYHLDLLLWHEVAKHLLIVEAAVCAALALWLGKAAQRAWGAFALCGALGLAVSATTPSSATRVVLVSQERRAYPAWSYTEAGPPELHGASNYRVRLELPGAVIVPLYFIDSGGGQIESAIRPEQIAWLRGFPPAECALAFVHIAPLHFGAAFRPDECEGEAPRENASACPGSEALLQTLRDLGVRGVFVGHDHGTAWCCASGAMRLCYGKHSGFGGYSLHGERGARVIEVNGSSIITTRVALWP